MLQIEKNNLINFIRTNKFFIYFSFFITLITYGIKLFYFDYSIDSEEMMNNPVGKIASWQTIGRSGLVLFKKVFHLPYFNPYFSNFFTLINLFLFSIILGYLVYRIGGDLIKKSSLFFIPLLIITHPIMLEQLNFSLQNMEVSFGMSMVCLSVLCLFLYLEYRKRLLLIGSILLNILSFTMYQSFLPFFIALSILSFIFINLSKMNENEKITFKINFSLIAFYITIFFVSLILSNIFTKFIDFFMKIPSTSYLNDQIRWGKAPFSDIVSSILTDGFLTFFPKDNFFYSYSFIISFSLLLILCLKKCLSKQKNAVWVFIASIFLFVTPFILLFILGEKGPYRAQMPTYPAVIALGFILFSSQLSKKVYPLLVICLCALGYYQTLLTTNLAFSEHMKYQEEVQLTTRINSYLDQLGIGERKNYRLFIVGNYTPKSTSIITGDVLGQSFYEWDATTKYGVSNRAVSLMKSQGYNFLYPQESDLIEANKIKDSLAVWPKDNSVKIIDNLIIIKLSNNNP